MNDWTNRRSDWRIDGELDGRLDEHKLADRQDGCEQAGEKTDAGMERTLLKIDLTVSTVDERWRLKQQRNWWIETNIRPDGRHTSWDKDQEQMGTTKI